MNPSVTVTSSLVNKGNLIVKWGVEVFVPLLLGGLIYLFRPVRPVFLEIWVLWFPDLESGMAVMQSWGLRLPGWVRYNLPDWLWLFAGLRMIQGVWGFRWQRGSLLWGGVLGMTALGSEVLQAVGVLGGTGDWGDGLGYGGVIVYLLCLHPFFFNNN